jgi:hypothetical protein
MDHHRFKPAFILILSFSTFAIQAQSSPQRGARTSQASLTVTAVVQSSVGVVATDDGAQEVFVANAPDSPATPSRVDPLKSNGQATVIYSFPTGRFQYELARETVFSKATFQPLTVITVVPR